MVTNNKVLTVSYGTFSCTLEGFDESFETMKAIAEYFRDLASDDRYFGAEPPTPDAEMLARIAEREVERRVQARTEHGAIVLTTKPAVAEITEDMPATKTPSEQADTPVVIEETAAAASQEDGEVAIEDVGVETIDVTDDILAAVAEDVPETALDDAEETVAAEVEIVEEISEEIAETVVESEGEAVDAPEAPETEESQPDLVTNVFQQEGDVEEAMAEQAPAEASAAEIIPEDLIAEADPVDAEPVEEIEPLAEVSKDEDSIAAKLQRIRAVVSKSRELPEEETFSEDEHAEGFLSATARDIETVLKLDDEMAAAAEAEDAQAAVSTEESAQEETVQEDAPEAEEEQAEPTRARVVRMKKADFEAAVQTGLLEAEPEEVVEEAAPETPESSLSANDEAELMAELAQVEAELKGSDESTGENTVDNADEAPEDVIEALPEVEAVRPARGRHLREASSQSDADMARLMEATQSHLDEPDGSRRRQAIAHLRAAVAATKAEKKSGKDSNKTRDVAEVYRDDLASVVSPVAVAPRPQDAPPAQTAGEPPLKLVAEQRIDTPPAAADQASETRRAPVRPRRVSAADRTENSAPAASAAPADGETTSFSEFAEEVGAVQLHDVLEAAASYLTFVEGRDVFSRPMIVRMARDMDESGFSREDSLRGFGQLLRENKITKISGGRFTASEEIGFRPEDRATG